MNPTTEGKEDEKIFHLSVNEMNAMINVKKKYADKSYESLWRAFVRSTIAHMLSHHPTDNRREDLFKYPFIRDTPGTFDAYDQKMFDEDYKFVQSHLQDWYPNIKQ